MEVSNSIPSDGVLVGLLGCFDSATTILVYMYWDRTGSAGVASFPGLV
jgi:hypothetical protein